MKKKNRKSPRELSCENYEEYLEFKKYLQDNKEQVEHDRQTKGYHAHYEIHNTMFVNYREAMELTYTLETNSGTYEMIEVICGDLRSYLGYAEDYLTRVYGYIPKQYVIKHVNDDDFENLIENKMEIFRKVKLPNYPDTIISYLGGRKKI